MDWRQGYDAMCCHLGKCVPGSHEPGVKPGVRAVKVPAPGTVPSAHQLRVCVWSHGPCLCLCVSPCLAPLPVAAE